MRPARAPRPARLARVVLVVDVAWKSLRRDRVALLLSFVLPLVFFSIFAQVFGGLDAVADRRVEVGLVAPSPPGDAAARLVARIGQREEIRVVEVSETVDPAEWVRAGGASVAFVLPADGSLDASPADSESRPTVEVLADPADPVAVQIALEAIRAETLRLGVEMLTASLPAAGVDTESRPPIAVVVRDVQAEAGKRPSIAYFAAGLGVLFLLFTTANRGAILLEERESGVLPRLLAAGLGLGELLLGRWLFLVAVGTAQVTVMFVYGALVFGLDLFTPRHLVGFAVLTPVTAAAAAAFGIVLASACRTRAQLFGVSTVVVLVLSALGGSLFPRFLMPESLQSIGRLTFNAWALDGYQKIFWNDAPVTALLPELAGLALAAVAFLLVARSLAGRWIRG